MTLRPAISTDDIQQAIMRKQLLREETESPEKRQQLWWEIVELQHRLSEPQTQTRRKRKAA